MPRQRPRPATGKRNSKHKPKLDVPEPELTAMLEQYYDLRTQLVVVDHRRLAERPTASPERKSMPPTASITSVPHHEGGYRGRYAYSERCTCGNHIETDDLRDSTKCRIAHAHHRTPKAREHSRRLPFCSPRRRHLTTFPPPKGSMEPSRAFSLP